MSNSQKFIKVISIIDIIFGVFGLVIGVLGAFFATYGSYFSYCLYPTAGACLFVGLRKKGSRCGCPEKYEINNLRSYPDWS